MTAYTLIGILALYFAAASAALAWLTLPGLRKRPGGWPGAVVFGLGLTLAVLVWAAAGAWVLWQGWLNELLFNGLGMLARLVLAIGVVTAGWLWLWVWLLCRRLGIAAGRRRRMALVVTLLVVMGAGGRLALRLASWPQALEVSRYTVTVPGLPRQLEGLTILQVSDIHYAPYSARMLESRLAPLRSLHPDLVVGTGDYTSSGARNLLAGARLARSIPGRQQWGVQGNHDVWAAGGMADEIITAAGIRTLYNEHVRLAAGCYLAGVGDPYTGNADLGRALAGIPQGSVAILLCHTPHLATQAARAGVTIMLCGHTHGGLVSLPVLGPPRFLTVYRGPWVRGVHRVGKMLLFVNRGVAGRYRVSCRPEAILLTLERGGGEARVVSREEHEGG